MRKRSLGYPLLISLFEDPSITPFNIYTLLCSESFRFAEHQTLFKPCCYSAKMTIWGKCTRIFKKSLRMLLVCLVRAVGSGIYETCRRAAQNPPPLHLSPWWQSIEECGGKKWEFEADPVPKLRLQWWQRTTKLWWKRHASTVSFFNASSILSFKM